MSENESEEEIKSDVEMKEEKEIMLKDTSLLDQLSTTKYNYDTNENKEIVFYNYIPMNENFKVQNSKRDAARLLEAQNERLSPEQRRAENTHFCPIIPFFSM